MQTFYVFRHAETLATKTHQDYGDQIFSAHILPESTEPIKKIAEYLKNIDSNHNFSSEFVRCTETAEVVTDITEKKFVLDKRLNEFFNEDFQQLKERVQSFVKDLNNSGDENILICTHGGVIAALKHLITSNNFTADELTDYPKPGVLVVISKDQVREIDFNSHI